MKHPFLHLTNREQKWLVVSSLTITFAGLIVLGLIDPGRVTGSGTNIVGLELAGCKTQAAQIIAGWGDLGTRIAAFNLGFDYLFIVGYSTLMTLMCIWASRRHSIELWAWVGVALAWMQWIAGGFDCAEDAALLAILFGGASESRAEIARACAIVKFSLLGCGALYVLVVRAKTIWMPEAS